LEIILRGLKREITYVQFHQLFLGAKTASYRAVPENRVSESANEETQTTIYHATNRTELNPIGAYCAAINAEYKSYFAA